MAVTRRSSVISSQRLHVHHHHHSSSPSNFNLGLRLYPGNNCNSNATTSDGTVPNRIKRTCLCSPTTHPGSFLCAFHRRLENQKTVTLANNNCSSSSSRKNVGVNLRKLAIVNSLAKIGTVEAEWLRRSMADTLIRGKTLFLEGPPPDFRPQRSYFYTLYKNQNM